MDTPTVADFCIAIDFQRGSEAPGRVFRALSDLIDAFYAFDLDLVQSIDPKIKPVVLLEDIETGSVKTWLQYALQGIDDDALKRLDWKMAVGPYLVKGKYLLINWLQGKTEIKDRVELKQLEGQLWALAQETKVDHVLTYSPMAPQKLVQGLQKMLTATSPLIEGDRLRYITRETETDFNLQFRMIPENIEDLITRESIDTTTDMILKVKKPDYLGESKWEFRHENRLINVRVSDVEWLRSFQNRQVDVRPQDSIRAKVRITTKYGYDFNVVAANYEILEVKEVMPADYPVQDGLL